MHPPPQSPVAPSEYHAEVARLVDEMRARCLWFLRPDYYPETPDEIDRTLRAIERAGDQTAFQRARALRQWHSPTSSATSAGS
ncbi:MAG: hypothetical protein KBF21_21025 [Thermoanaerobaculia bacterium]|jgi:hypothetical protein|nr:hypothetical protein [Thermoanaerobaculia bacterium]MBP9826724.1 hypothetical protein [Thermoanaerobaculia bacterium]